MTWTSPPTVVTGQLYTAAMFNTYTRDNPNHLKALLPDASGANLALVSSGATSAAFGLLPDAAMLNQKTNIVNPVYTTFAAVASGYSGFFQVSNGLGIADSPIALNDWFCLQIRYPNAGIDYRVQVAWSIADNTNTYQRTIIGGVPTAWAKIWNSVNDGSGSGLDANTVIGLSVGNGTNNIPVDNSIMSTGLNSQYLQGYTPSNTGAVGILPIANGVLNTGLNADQVDTHHANDITPLNARVWFDSVAEVTAAGAHWARDVALNGRLLLSADEAGGNPSGVVFNPATNYGSHWVPMTGLGVTAGTLAGTTAAIAATSTLSVSITGGGGVAANNIHTHPAAAVTVSGAPALTGVATQWLPMMRAGIWAKKS